MYSVSRLAEDQPSDNRDSKRTPQFRSRSRAERERNAAQQRGHRRHHDRPEAQQARLVNRLQRRLVPSLRSASSAKSIIMMAFFFTMPMSSTMPDERDDAEVVVRKKQGQQRSHARRRESRQNRDRVYVALVQNAQNDVDRDQGCQDQHRLIRQRGLKRRSRPLECTA